MTDEQIEKLLVEIRNISYGGNGLPKGMEALVMALSGDVDSDSVGQLNIVDCLEHIAEAVEDLALAIREGHNE